MCVHLLGKDGLLSRLNRANDALHAACAGLVLDSRPHRRHVHAAKRGAGIDPQLFVEDVGGLYKVAELVGLVNLRGTGTLSY
jgi:hypothetical protein